MILRKKNTINTFFCGLTVRCILVECEIDQKLTHYKFGIVFVQLPSSGLYKPTIFLQWSLFEL